MNSEFLELIKKEMKENIDKLTFDNFDKHEELFKKYWSIGKQLKEVSEYQVEHNLKNEKYLEEEDVVESASEELNQEEPSEQVSEQMSEECDETEEEIIAEQESPTYLFERKLRGGYVPDINGFVPEGVVRRLGLEHGDLVRAKLLKEQDDNHKFYHYEIAEKGLGEDAPERVQYNYCIVKNIAGRLAVDRSEESSKLIRCGEEIYTVLIDEHDIHEHRIQEGAIIDIAFYRSNPDRPKVLWNHKIEEVPESNEKKTPNKKKLEKVDEDPYEPIEQSLSGFTILLIGDEPKRHHYEEAINNRGGTLLTADAKDKLNRLEPLVRKSDLVILLLSVSGHTGGEHVKQMCRDYNVPFETKWGLGFSGVIRLAEEKLTQVS